MSKQVILEELATQIYDAVNDCPEGVSEEVLFGYVESWIIKNMPQLAPKGRRGVFDRTVKRLTKHGELLQAWHNRLFIPTSFPVEAIVSREIAGSPAESLYRAAALRLAWLDFPNAELARELKRHSLGDFPSHVVAQAKVRLIDCGLWAYLNWLKWFGSLPKENPPITTTPVAPGQWIVPFSTGGQLFIRELESGGYTIEFVPATSAITPLPEKTEWNRKE